LTQAGPGQLGQARSEPPSAALELRRSACEAGTTKSEARPSRFRSREDPNPSHRASRPDVGHSRSEARSFKPQIRVSQTSNAGLQVLEEGLPSWSCGSPNLGDASQNLGEGASQLERRPQGTHEGAWGRAGGRRASADPPLTATALFASLHRPLDGRKAARGNS
jgi:hypothetical protein